MLLPSLSFLAASLSASSAPPALPPAFAKLQGPVVFQASYQVVSGVLQQSTTPSSGPMQIKLDTGTYNNVYLALDPGVTLGVGTPIKIMLAGSQPAKGQFSILQMEVAGSGAPGARRKVPISQAGALHNGVAWHFEGYLTFLVPPFQLGPLNFANGMTQEESDWPLTVNLPFQQGADVTGTVWFPTTQLAPYGIYMSAGGAGVSLSASANGTPRNLTVDTSWSGSGNVITSASMSFSSY